MSFSVRQCLGAVVGAVLNYVIMKIVVSANRDILLSVQGTNVWSGASVQSFNRSVVHSMGSLSPLILRL